MQDAASSSTALRQFVELASTTQGGATAALIKRALSKSKLFVFGELIHHPNIANLRGTPHESALELLEIFAYGSYDDIKANPDKFKLNAAQLNKIKQLTVVDMAGEKKTIPYKALQERLDISSLRELEDLIISCFYAGILEGKLNQRGQELHVSNAMGRDVRSSDIDDMVAKLTAWRERSVDMLAALSKRLEEAEYAHKMEEEEKKKHSEQAEVLKVKAVKTLTEKASGGGGSSAAAGAPAAASWGAMGGMGMPAPMEFPDEAARRGRPKRRLGQVGGGGGRT